MAQLLTPFRDPADPLWEQRVNTMATGPWTAVESKNANITASNTNGLQCRIVNGENVQLRGFCEVGAEIKKLGEAKWFALPAGFRPVETLQITTTTATGTDKVIEVKTNGEFGLTSSIASENISLHNVLFPIS